MSWSCAFGLNPKILAGSLVRSNMEHAMLSRGLCCKAVSFAHPSCFWTPHLADVFEDFRIQAYVAVGLFHTSCECFFWHALIPSTRTKKPGTVSKMSAWQS